MKYYLLAMSSLTRANAGRKLLLSSGVRAAVVKTPAYLSPRGCAYALRVSASAMPGAGRLLSGASLAPVKIFGSRDGVRWSEL